MVDFSTLGAALSSIVVLLVVCTTLPSLAVAAVGFLRAYVLFPVATEKAQDKACRASLVGMYAMVWFIVSFAVWGAYVSDVLD